nr:histone H1 [Cryptomonas sp.]
MLFVVRYKLLNVKVCNISCMEKITVLKDCVDKIAKDAYKFFEKNNKAAGVRARKKLQKCKKCAQEIRNLIQKSKQEHVQRKAAAAANAAALNSDKYIQDADKQKDIFDLRIESANYVSKSDPLFLQENELCKPFLKESIRNYDVSKSVAGTKNYTRIDSLPPLNGEPIGTLRQI